MAPSDGLIAELSTLVAAEAATAGDGPEPVGWLRRLVRTVTRDLGASGVGVCLVSDGGELVTTAVSPSATNALEALQFDFGEGPCIDVFATRRPVLVADLDAHSRTDWPGYAPAALGHGVRAVFAFPLQVGAACLGAMDVYRDQPGNLSSTALTRALTYAELAVQSLLDAQQAGVVGSFLIDEADNRFEVYQAQGMIMVQLGINAADALARLRGHAYSENRSLGDVAADVVARRLNLEEDP